MARTTTVYKVFPNEPTVISPEPASWPITGAASIKAALENEKKTHEEALGTSILIKSAVAAAKLEGAFAMPTLATGEVIVACRLWANCKTNKAELSGTFGIAGVSSEEIKSTTQGWLSLTVFMNEVSTAAKREALKWKIERTKNTVTIYEFYLEIETKTETSVLLRSFSMATPSGTANAERKFTTSSATVAIDDVGDLLSVSVVTNGTGCTALTDSSGNTYRKDAEESAAGVNVSLWSCAAGKAEAVTWTATVGATGDTVVITAQEMWPIVEASRVFATGYAKGTGTAVEAGTITTRSAQGDLVIAAVGAATTEAVSLAGETISFANVMSGTALSDSIGRYTSATLPGEGVAVTPKGTYSKAVTAWAAVVVSYRVLASPDIRAVAAPGARQAVQRASVA